MSRIELGELGVGLCGLLDDALAWTLLGEAGGSLLPGFAFFETFTFIYIQ